MKKIATIFCLIGACMLYCGCEDFAEDYGYSLYFNRSAEVTAVHSHAEDYTLDVSCMFELAAGAPDIQEAGFICTFDGADEQMFPGTYQDQTITGSLPGLSYGTTVTIIPYIITAEGLIKGNTEIYRSYSKASFSPQTGEGGLSMNETGKLRIEVPYVLADATQAVTHATLTFSGQQLPVRIEEGKIVADIDLSDLPGAGGSVFSLSLGNAMGTTESYIPFAVTLSEATTQYPDDGNKEDCIRLCGVDWAKGNLQYEKGTWKIAERQDATFAHISDYGTNPDYVEHFSYGKPEAALYYHDLIYHNQWYTDAFEEDGTICSIQGDPATDVVAAHISGGWCLPEAADLRLLISSCSWQYGYTERNGVQTYGYLFYTNGKGIAQSSTLVKFNAENMDDMGLFLPSIGYVSSFSNNIWKQCSYMSATAYKNKAFYIPLSTYGYVVHLNQYESTLEVRSDINHYSDAHSGEYQFAVRPIKGEVKENSYERALNITPGDCIDLGLSVKWAACNAGASSPEEKGLEFRWATAGYGGYDTGLWRMPTATEVEELLKSCTWTWGVYQKVNGYQVTGPNGNSIFLPAYYIENHIGVYRVGSHGYGINNYTIDLLGISSHNHVLTNYGTHNFQYSTATYCVRPVSIE